ncbi:uncharacterized protein LOC131253564 [Magnolia sinica]|uniref:uncharacterized protein LOC131253564 n=1 Tax=Magnolia sinica TaxID=86752 RepID=UPI0026587E54|nr:uncharacterized protein LOC131253564 [Magnolia sinica]
MCPLRLILIFLSATFAGFLLLKGLKSKPELEKPDDSSSTSSSNPLDDDEPARPASKVLTAISSAFWTCIDMASGRYLWRNLTSSSSTSKQQ